MKASKKIAPPVVSNNTRQALQPFVACKNEISIYQSVRERWLGKMAERIIFPRSFCFFLYLEKKKGRK